MSDFHNKLVDLYAGQELTEELNEELEMAAMRDATLAHEMFTLRKTYDALKGMPEPVYTEESEMRILLKLQLQGADISRRSAESSHWQYHLPILS